MPKPIEARIYRAIEWNLRHIDKLREEYFTIKDDVLYGSGEKIDTGTASGKHADPTAIGALKIIDSKPSLWFDAINETYSYYSDSTMEGRVARMLYMCKLNFDDIAVAVKCSRRMLFFYRDNFVTRCAMHAAEKGLIKLTGGRQGNARNL